MLHREVNGMEQNINGHTLELKIGDITEEEADAIVNAANGSLMGGGGVDGAIHRAAGNRLSEECKQIRDEELGGEHLGTGEAVITEGYLLPASYVIHTVGPVWGGDESEKDELLTNCYRHALEIASDKRLGKICFPSISTGIYRFPVERAASIAIGTIRRFLESHAYPSHVTMVLFSDSDYKAYAKAMKHFK